MPKTRQQEQKPADFTPSAKALETILERFRSGQLTLEESLALFEEGVGHLKTCQAVLTASRGKVEVLLKTLQEDGASVTEPFGASDAEDGGEAE